MSLIKKQYAAANFAAAYFGVSHKIKLVFILDSEDFKNL